MGDDHHTFSEFYSEKALCRGQHSYKKMKFVKEGGRVRPIPIEGVQTADQIALSEELAPLFPSYLNSLGLKDEQGNVLKLDDSGEGSFKEYIKKWLLASAQSEYDSHDSENRLARLSVPGSAIGLQDYLTVEGGEVKDLP